MSLASSPERGARKEARPTISFGTELAVLALPAVLFALLASGPAPQQAHATNASTVPPKLQTLRVCADPNNMPFSNERQQGFENRIASLIARDLGVPVQYTWWPERRGFVRNTLKARTCDVVMQVPAGYELTEHTAPYYRSTYVFVTRADRHLTIRSVDDPALRHLRIGIHRMGADSPTAPAASALARRGLAAQIVPFMIYGDYSQPDPPAQLIRAVVTDSVDVAVAWGPLAGYFAKRSPVRLVLTPVTPASREFAYSMAMGVRHGDSATRSVLDTELARRRADIRRILEDYGVPLVESSGR